MEFETGGIEQIARDKKTELNSSWHDLIDKRAQTESRGRGGGTVK